MSEEAIEAVETPKVDAVLKSLTGFDEQAIERHFGKSFVDLGGTMTARAAAFTVIRRRGMADKDAFRQTMDMTLSAVDDFFGVSAAAAAVDDEGND